MRCCEIHRCDEFCGVNVRRVKQSNTQDRIQTACTNYEEPVKTLYKWKQ
jgi:hypothetical protein